MNSVEHISAKLAGYKTYAVALVTVLYAWGVQKNVWPHNATVDLVLGAGGLASIRSAIKTELVKIAQAWLANPPTLPPLPVSPPPATPPATVPVPPTVGPLQTPPA